MRAITVGLVLTTLLGAAVAMPTASAQQQQQQGITRVDLQRHDIDVPGREAIQVRVAFEPGAAFGRHRHPGEEIIYVLEGSLEYEIEGRPRVTLEAGDALFIPTGTIHSARNAGSVKAAELATYIVEKDKPLVELEKR
jgi:quercetin dioxygenase-like cupin family protein